MLSPKAKAIRDEKISNIFTVLTALYSATKNSYSPFKWSEVCKSANAPTALKNVLLSRDIVRKSATRSLYHWQFITSIPNWDMAERLYEDCLSLRRKETTNQAIESNFKTAIERKKLIPINLNPVISKLPTIKKPGSESDSQRGKHWNRIERRIDAIRKILYYCATPRNSIELKAKLKEVTCGAPTLQWLKLNGWLLSTERGKWVNIGEMDPSRFDEACLNKLKADLKKGNIGSVVDVRKATNQESQNSKLVDLQKRINENVLDALGNETIDTWRRYMCNNIKEHTYNEIFNWLVNNKYFVCTNLTPLSFQVNGLVPEISYEEVVRMNNDIKLGLDSTKALRYQDKLMLETAEKESQSFIKLKEVIDDKILTIKQYGNDKFHHYSNILLREGIKKERQIILWLINNNYLVYCGGGAHYPSFDPSKIKPSIELIVVKSLLKDIEDGNKNTLGFLPEVIKKQIEDFETINKDKSWPEITEKTSTLSSVDALKEERIKFAKMLFKLGDVKGANEILEKEV